MATEQALVSAILNTFGSRPGVRLWRCNTGVARTRTGRVVRFGLPGQADIQGVLAPHGRHVSIECKAGRGQQSQEQVRWQQMIEKHGGLYILARTVGDVEDCLSRTTTATGETAWGGSSAE